MGWLQLALKRAARSSKQRHCEASQRRRWATLNRSIRPVAQALEPRVLLSAVSWVGAASGLWTDGTNWSTATVPTSADDVTINATAGVTVTVSGASVANSVTSNNDLILASSTLTINTTLTLTGGSSCMLNGGTLINATVTGPLFPNGSGSTVDVQDVTLNSDQAFLPNHVLRFHGLTLNNVNITEPAALVADAGGDLLGTGQITFSGGAPFFTLGSGAVTVGPNILLNGASGLITTNAGSTLTLQGTVQADAPGTGFEVAGTGVTNTGTIQAINGGTLQLVNDFVSPGVIKEINSTIDIFSTFSAVSAISSVGGVVNLHGTVDLASGTQTTAATLTLVGGTITNGTLGFSGGAQLLASASGGTFDNLTLNSNVTIPNGATLAIQNGLTLNNADITMTAANVGTVLDFNDNTTQTLSGTGQIIFAGSAPNFDFITAENGSGDLTIAPGILIRGPAGRISTTTTGGNLNLSGIVKADSAGSGISITGSNIVNTGTIQAITGGSINLRTDVGQSGIVNENGGTLNIDAQLQSIANITRSGGTVNLGATGVLNGLDSGTFTFDASTGSWNLFGTVLNAALAFSSGSQLIPAGTTGHLSNVSLNNDLTIPDGAKLTVTGGLHLNNANLILASSGGSTTAFFTLGTQQINGTGQIVFAGSAPAHNLILTDGALTISNTINIVGPAGTIQTVSTASIQMQGNIEATTLGQAIVLSGANILAQGELEAIPGIIVVNGDFSALAVGTILIGIDGSGAGELDVTGNANFGGALAISLLNGFVPPQNNTFNILNYQSQAGTFASVTGLTSPGVTFSQTTGPTALSLTTVQGGPPIAFTDLEVTASTDTPGTYLPGDVLIATATETATGPGASGPFSTQLFLSQDSIFGNSDDILLQTIQSTGFSGAGTTIGNFQAAIPTTAAPGTYRLLIKIDSAGTVSETNETNNIFVAPTADIVVATPPVVPKSTSVGALDPNFGVNGIASNAVGLSSASDVLVRSDGKSVIVGTAGATGAQDFAVTRFNSDGTVDTTFGTGGVVTTDFGGRDDQATAASLLSDGRILVVGTSSSVTGAGSEFALARYNASGSLDTTFGNGTGKELISFSADPVNAPSVDAAHGVVLRSDGGFFVAGTSNANGAGTDFAIASFNPDGSLSTAFNGSGKVLTDFAGGDDSANAVTLQGSSLVVVGSTQNPASGVVSIGVAEYLASGALNAKFGARGKITTSLRGVDDEASSVAIGPKGVIVVGGLSATGSAATRSLSTDFALVRYTSLGKVDKTFGKGRVITSFGQPSAITSIIVAPDGSVTASGKTVGSLVSAIANQLDIAIARYDSKGVLDRAFNGSGKLVVSLGQAAPAIVLHPFDLVQQFKDFTQSAQGVVATTQGGELLALGTQGDATVEAVIVTSGVDLSAIVTGRQPASVTGGKKGTATVKITNSGTNFASGAVMVSLFASPSPKPQTGDALIKFQPQAIKLKAKKGKTIKFSFAFPNSLADGNYFLVAQINTGAIKDLSVINNIAASSSTVHIQQAVR